MKRTELSEGIYLNIIESDKFKTDYFDLNIILPLREETASLAALLPLVLKRGCAKYPTMSDITKRLDYLYSTGFSTRITKRGENQIISFSADFLRESLVPSGENLADEVFDALREIIFNPLVSGDSFKSDYVESEKKNLIDSINALINNKNAYATEKCHQAMCKGQDFAVNKNGNPAIINKISGKELYSFYIRLISSAQFEIFYTGKCDEGVLINRVKKLFGGIPRRYISAPCATQKFVRTRENVMEITEEIAAAQGKLILGFRSGHIISDNDYTAYSLFNELYGGSPTSKLFENVREKLSLCYYCRSVPESHKGILTVAAGIEIENRDKAVNEIIAQLENTKKGIISDEEFISAKNSLINSYRELYDDGASLSAWYLSRLIGHSEKSLEDVINSISAVTKEDIAKCARDTELDTIYFLKGTLKNGGDEE